MFGRTLGSERHAEIDSLDQKPQLLGERDWALETIRETILCFILFFKSKKLHFVDKICFLDTS